MHDDDVIEELELSDEPTAGELRVVMEWNDFDQRWRARILRLERYCFDLEWIAVASFSGRKYEKVLTAAIRRLYDEKATEAINRLMNREKGVLFIERADWSCGTPCPSRSSSRRELEADD